MQELKDHVSKKYWIAHDASTIVHWGDLEVGNVITTGQPTLEDFDVEQTWLDRLVVLGITDPNPTVISNPVAS